MKILSLIAVMFCYIGISAQNLNMELVSQTEYSSDGNDIWGLWMKMELNMA